MAFATEHAAVTDVRSVVWNDGRSTNGYPTGKFLVRNIGVQTAYVGGAAVTSANGMPVAEDEILTVAGVGPRDELNAVCAAGQSTTLVFLWSSS